MTQSERIIVSFLLHATPPSSDWHSILYMILEDLEITCLGTIQTDIPDILTSQQLYREYCLGCHTYTGQLGLEIVPTCPHCSDNQR